MNFAYAFYIYWVGDIFGRALIDLLFLESLDLFVIKRVVHVHILVHTIINFTMQLWVVNYDLR